MNDLVTDMPKDPISFLINGLLKAAAARGQEPDLLLRLQELKQHLAMALTSFQVQAVVAMGVVMVLAGVVAKHAALPRACEGDA